MKLQTEERNKNSLKIDELDTRNILITINNEDKTVAEKVEAEIDNISKVVDLLSSSMAKGGRIIYLGAGTSGRLAILDSAECPPTYGTSPDEIVALIAGGNEAILKAIENSEDSEIQAIEDLDKLNLKENDVIIGIAASGKTPYVIEGIKYAKSIGLNTVAIACNKNTIIGSLADLKIEVDTGPEVIMGSTRMKAGTAQKLILNMISTAVMIKLGKVYSNLMINVGSYNKKLLERQKIIVQEATNCTYEQAEETLNKTNSNCKLAIYSILSGLNVENARKNLEKYNENIKKALNI